MIRQFIILFVLFSFLTHAIRGADRIDSIKSVIADAAQLADGQVGDTSVCDAYLEWGQHIYTSNLDTAIILIDQALAIANSADLMKQKAQACSWLGYLNQKKGNIRASLKYYNRSVTTKERIILKLVRTNSNSQHDAEINSLKKEISTALNNIGFTYNDQGDIAKSLKFYLRSLKLREELKDKKGVAGALNNIGYVYSNQGDIDNALNYYHQSLKIRLEIGDENGQAYSINNIGMLYYAQGDTIKALENFHKCLDILRTVDNKKGVAGSLNNIGGVYIKLGDTRKGLKYYQESLKLREKIKDFRGVAISCNNIAGVYKNKGEFQTALEFYNKGMALQEEMGNKDGVAYTAINMGNLYLKQGDFELAKEYSQRGIALAKRSGIPKRIADAAKLASNLFRHEGNYEKALELFELHIQMRDSIKNEETQKATIRQQTKYEFEKAQLVKEQEEKEVRRQESEVRSRRDNLQYSVILIVILLLAAGLLLIGKINVSSRMAEGLIFFTFLLFFEFLLVLADPYIDRWSGGAPGFKLLFNAGIAALIFPAHAFFESRLKSKLVK